MKAEIRELSFSYKKTDVLNFVNAEFVSGGLNFVLGENGSGKSTMLKCLSGLLKVNSGDIVVDNINISGLSIKERSKLISYTPQNVNFDKYTLVYDFIMSGRKPWFSWRETPNDENFVYRIIAKLGIENFAMRKMGELSGGERQKVFIARALAQNARVMILDEPTNNLDIAFQIELFRLLSEEAEKTDRIIITAVHDINLALKYASFVTLLKNGEVIAGGNSADVITEKNILKMMNVECVITEVRGVNVMVTFN
jgi:iron complex transport system ATP-binding protein